MAKGIYIGVSSKARKVRRLYVGVGSKARKVKKMYIGVGGKARLCYSAELELAGTPTALDTPRYGMQAATVGNYALFAGGIIEDGGALGSISGCTDATDAYNASLTKSTPTALSVKRYGHAAATIGSRALFAGGASTAALGIYSGITSSVDAYNASLTRSSATALSEARRGMGAATVGSYALFAGGTSNNSDNSEVLLATVDVYNTSLTRTTATALSVARMDVRGASVGNYALFAGGSSLNYVDAYNASLTRTSAPLLNSPANSEAAATIGNYVIFAGSDATHNASIYNASLTKTVTSILSLARSRLSATTVGDYAVFAGGLADSKASAVVDTCDASLTRTTATALSVARYDMAATTVGDYAVFAGGKTATTDTGYADTVDTYTA